MKEIIFDRIKLYEEVWKEPVIEVAKRYGVPGQKMRNICLKLNIPVPSAGHWTKIKFGKRVDKPSLPDYEGTNILHVKYEDKNQSLSADDTEKTEFEVYCSKLIVSKEIDRPHLFVKKIMNDKKRGKSFDRRYFRVSHEQFNRAIIILDTILKATEKWNINMEIKADKNILLIFGKEQVSIAIKEKRTRNKLKEPWEEYEFTGQLTVTLGEHYYLKKIWSDKSTKKVEDYIGKIIMAIFAEAEEKRRLREVRRNDEIKREFERRERYRIQQLQEQETTKVEELVKVAHDYKKAEAIRDFIDVLSRQSNIAGINEDVEKLNTYIQWAKSKADWLDPLTAANDQVLGCKYEKWLRNITSR